MAKSASYNICDHDKPARDETSYSLRYSVSWIISLNAAIFFNREEVIFFLKKALDDNNRV